MKKPTILVLGGGFGGIRTARTLATKIGNDDGVTVARIIVFEKENMSLYHPSLTWLMVGKREAWQIQDELSETRLQGIEIIYGNIDAIDPDNITVTSNGQTFEGDFMVISLGTATEDRHGLTNFGHNFYTVEGATRFFRDLSVMRSGHIAIVVPSLPHKSPVAPYEAALLVDHYLRDKKHRDKITISLYTPEGRPMEFASDEISARVHELLDNKQIGYRPLHTLSAAKKGELTFSLTDETTENVPYDLLAFTPDHVSPKVIKDAGLTGPSGWIESDRNDLQTKFKNVFAIGDITSIVLDNGKELPKAGIFAQQQAEIVAHNITRILNGLSPDKTFDAKGAYILDEGSKASKVTGEFGTESVSINDLSVLRHWEKILTEKNWFLKNF